MPHSKTDSVHCDCFKCLALPHPDQRVVNSDLRYKHRRKNGWSESGTSPPTAVEIQVKADHRAMTFAPLPEYDGDIDMPFAPLPPLPVPPPREMPAVPPLPVREPPAAMPRLSRQEQDQGLDTQWEAVEPPSRPISIDADGVRRTAAAQALSEHPSIRLAYLRAVYNNVYKSLSIEDTEDNLASTLDSLKLAGLDPGAMTDSGPPPVRTLSGAKRRLGIDPDEHIIQYVLCPKCWKHYHPTFVPSLASPACCVQDCDGIIYEEKRSSSGSIQRHPFMIEPQVSPIEWLRRTARRKGFRKLLPDNRTTPVGQNKDRDFVMTDMKDGAAWHNYETGIRRERGDFGGIRDATAPGKERKRLTEHRFGLHLTVNMDWLGAFAGRPHSSGPTYLAINDLLRHVRFLQVFVCCLFITPGPKEPTTQQLCHCMEPSVYEFGTLKEGITVEMYDEDDVTIVEEELYADVACDNCDTPAARKISGTAGHSASLHPCPWCRCLLVDLNQVETYRENTFVHIDDYDMLKQKYYSRIGSDARQKSILKTHGVQWAAFDALPGWRPATQTVLDFMHCIFLGIVCFLFTKVLSAAHMLSGAGEHSAKYRFESIINSIRWPSHITRLPKNLGDNQSLHKADEWRRLLTVAPVVLWWAWKSDDDSIPDTEPSLAPNETVSVEHSRSRAKLYEAILLLCVAVRLWSNKAITMAQAAMAQSFFAQYCEHLISLNVALTISHHLAMHFTQMIYLFGPVYGWWLFAFERFNGMLEKVNLNGHDGGQVELTMLRYWVQTHLLYEFLLELPADASSQERDLIKKIIRTDISRARGGMMTELAILQAETSIDRVSLPKQRLGKPTNLFNLPLRAPQPDSDIYTLLFEHAHRIWNGQIRRELTNDPGHSFVHDRVACILPYVRKDGLRYGSTSNRRTQSDCYAFIVDNGARVPIEIERLFLLRIPDTNLPQHVCCVVRRLPRAQLGYFLPWNMFKGLLGIYTSFKDEYLPYEVIPASDIDCPLAMIPARSGRLARDLWISVSFDHVAVEPSEPMEDEQDGEWEF